MPILCSLAEWEKASTISEKSHSAVNTSLLLSQYNDIIIFKWYSYMKNILNIEKMVELWAYLNDKASMLVSLLAALMAYITKKVKNIWAIFLLACLCWAVCWTDKTDSWWTKDSSFGFTYSNLVTVKRQSNLIHLHWNSSDVGKISPFWSYCAYISTVFEKSQG